MSDDIMYDSKEDCYMVSEERLDEFEKALKERDELEIERDKYKTARDGWYKKAIGYLKERNTLESERDELAAELERVKAERDGLKGRTARLQAKVDQRMSVDLELSDTITELSTLKSRLPVNSDGDVVLWGDEVWGWTHSGKPFKIIVTEIVKGVSEYDGKDFYYLKGIGGCGGSCRFHSTAESCRAAHEGKEGENDATETNL